MTDSYRKKQCAWMQGSFKRRLGRDYDRETDGALLAETFSTRAMNALAHQGLYSDRCLRDFVASNRDWRALMLKFENFGKACMEEVLGHLQVPPTAAMTYDGLMLNRLALALAQHDAAQWGGIAPQSLNLIMAPERFRSAAKAMLTAMTDINNRALLHGAANLWSGSPLDHERQNLRGAWCEMIEGIIEEKF